VPVRGIEILGRQRTWAEEKAAEDMVVDQIGEDGTGRDGTEDVVKISKV
jgi:hypothetical protein